MTTDRDTLWNLLDDRLPERDIVRSDIASSMVDAVEAAGWRPPARVVADGGEVEAIAIEWMRYVGFTAEQIAEAEAQSCADTCERVGDAWDCTDPDGDSRHPVVDELAGAVAMATVAMETIESRGWRPPAHKITTAVERDALPVGALVRSDDGFVAVRVNAHSGEVPGRSSRYPWDSIVLPVTVMYVPTEKTGR